MQTTYFFLVCSVLTLTVAWAIGAVVIARFGRTPPAPFSERLFETFVSMTTAGFFSLLGLLAAHGQ